MSCGSGTETWKAEQRAFAARGLTAVDYVYLWGDGIHVNIRPEEHKLCLLVLIGVRADGRKELIAGEAGSPSVAYSRRATVAGDRPRTSVGLLGASRVVAPARCARR